jgi:hypothetical protein
MVGMYSARRTAARPPPNHPPPAPAPAVAIPRGQADEGGNPTARQVAQLGQVGDQRVRRDIPNARRRGQQVFRLPPHRAGADELRDFAFELLDRAREPRDVGPDALPQPLGARLAVPVLLRSQHVHELAAPGHELPEHLGLFRGQRPRRRLHRLGKAGIGARIEPVRLRQLPAGPRELPDLPGIDHRHREPRVRERRRDRALIAAGGFQYNQRRAQAGQPMHQRGHPRLIVGHRELLIRGSYMHVQPVLRHIEPHKDPFHAPSLSMRARRAAQATVRVHGT